MTPYAYIVAQIAGCLFPEGRFETSELISRCRHGHVCARDTDVVVSVLSKCRHGHVCARDIDAVVSVLSDTRYRVRRFGRLGHHHKHAGRPACTCLRWCLHVMHASPSGASRGPGRLAYSPCGKEHDQHQQRCGDDHPQHLRMTCYCTLCVPASPRM
jgi:hypothetical protein